WGVQEPSTPSPTARSANSPSRVAIDSPSRVTILVVVIGCYLSLTTGLIPATTSFTSPPLHKIPDTSAGIQAEHRHPAAMVRPPPAGHLTHLHPGDIVGAEVRVHPAHIPRRAPRIRARADLAHPLVGPARHRPPLL